MYSSDGRRLILDSVSTAELAQTQHRGHETSEGRSRKRRDSRASEQPANSDSTSSRRSVSRPSTPNSVASSDSRSIKDFSSEQKQAPSALRPVPDLPARFIDRYGESISTKSPAEKSKKPSISSVSHLLKEEPRKSVRSPESSGPARGIDIGQRQHSLSLRPHTKRSSPSSYPDPTSARRAPYISKQASSPAISLQEDQPPKLGSQTEVRSPASHTRQQSTTLHRERDQSRDRSRNHGSSTPPYRPSFDRSYDTGIPSPAFSIDEQPTHLDSPGSRKSHASKRSQARAPEWQEAVDPYASPRRLEVFSSDKPDSRRPVEAMESPMESWHRSSPRDGTAMPLPAAGFVKPSRGAISSLNPPESMKYNSSKTQTTGGYRIRDKGRRRSQSTSQPPFDPTSSSSGVGNYVTASDFSSDQILFPPISTPVTDKSRRYQDATLSNETDANYNSRSWKHSSSAKSSPSTTKFEVTSLRSSRLTPRKHHTRTASNVQVEKSGASKSMVYPMPTEATNRRVDEKVGSPPVNISPTREEQSQHRHYKAPSVSNSLNSRIHLRNDDSMTYVAVTTSGSSPQSDSDDVSDMSDYPDRGDVDDTIPPSYWTNDNGVGDEYSQAVRRREALLTGLGLGLSNVDASPQAIDAALDSRERQEDLQNVSFGVASSYSYDDTMVHDEEQIDHNTSMSGGHPFSRKDDTQRVERSTHGEVLQTSHSRILVLGQHPIDPTRSDFDSPQHTTPRPRIAGKFRVRRIPSEPDHAISTRRTEWNGSPMPHDTPMQEMLVDSTSRDNSRRDTWVYDGSDLPTGVTEHEVGENGRLDENRNDSFSLVWSDNDSMVEPLSENAQRMFQDLQQGTKPRSEVSSSEEAKASRLVSSPHPYEELPTIVHADSVINPTRTEGEWAPEQLLDNSLTQSRTWRNTVTGQAYQSLLEKHGITEMKRQDVIFELCETEMTFVKSVKITQRLFADPLKSYGGWFEGLPQIYTQLFDWLDEIVQVHSGLASALHSARSSQFPIVLNFAEYVRPFVPRLEAHQPYLVHLEEAIKYIDSLLRDPKSKLGEFIRMQTCNRECGNLSLTSFLLQPMQRLTKYPLFFKQLWEMTPRNHPDHLPMFSLYNSTHLMITVMQEVKAREEEFNYVKDLASRISGFPQNFCLAQRERRLIAQGLLRRVALSDKDRDILDGLRTSTPLVDSSPRPPASLSPVPSPQTPSFPDLAKIGPITSPLFPAYHNRTPVAVHSSPYSPRRSFMSVISRASTALSEATRMSEWTSSYSPTSSINIPSDVDSRPDSSTSYASSLLRASSITSSRSKSREMPVYAFIFTDLVLLTTQTEKHGLFQSKSTPQYTSERMSLVDNIGICRVLGVTDRSLKLGNYTHLLEVDLLPITQRNSSHENPTSSVFLTLPSVGNSRVKLKPTEELTEAKDKWLSAFDCCYGYTLRALSFPSIIAPRPNEDLESSNQTSVMSLLSSGLPLPKNPSNQDSAIEGERSDSQETDANSREWWSRRFQGVLKDIEHTQDAPVMLIGDGALTMGRGLKKINTSDRTRRNGPQQLLLPASAALNPPSNSSSSGSGKKSLLGIRKR